MSGIGLFLFAVGWIVGIYLINSLFVCEFKNVHYKMALLYVTTVAMLGLFGEIFVDTIYDKMFGTPLWRYNVMPIHHAYTSVYAIFLWGAYGFYLYLLHDSLTKWSDKRQYRLAVLFAFEALLIEALVEITSKLVFGQYLYYYYPNGLWHISAFQNFPFYLICGFLIVFTIQRFKRSPYYFMVISSWLVVMVAFFM